MLQQTQVATVIPYFVRWIARFPTVSSLAEATEQDVLAMWQGLGYYRRCRMLLEGSKFVAANGMPSTAAAWRDVPGVGRYTAGAIASIASGEVTPLIDGNVERVFARLTGCDFSGSKLAKAAWDWAESLVDPNRPGDHNQALMELGATVCKPLNPSCPSCPLKTQCFAYQNSAQDQLPVKTERRKTVVLNQCVAVHYADGKFGLRQIPEGEWWQGMWEFPRSEANDPKPNGLKLGVVRHVVTHHKISLEVFLVSDTNNGLIWYREGELETLPLPAPQRRSLEMAQKHLRACEQATKTSEASV